MSRLTRFLNFFRINKSIAIDLGTSNVLIYDKQKNKIVLNEPSVIVKNRKTGELVAVGKEAKEMEGKTAESTVVIRPLTEGVISDIDATREMLSAFIRQIYGGSPFRPELMVCVPIEMTSVEKKAIFDAAIGAKKIYLLEEGKAAVVGSGVNISLPEGNTVIDIGGGSTDVAIISLGGTVVSKTIRVAGNNFDNDIVKYVKKTYNLLIGDRTAEEIKIKIGTALPLEEEETIEVKGRDLLMGLPKVITITSEEVREAIKDSLDQILQCIRTVLEKTPPELAADIVDKGMMMTGGGSLIRNFPEMITKYTNLKVNLAENPLESVVIGAGLALDQIDVLRKIEKAER